jgi:CheY-like chemotaxis protein/anti-anti-sigma regulatory factor
MPNSPKYYHLKFSGSIVTIEDCKKVSSLVKNLVSAGKYHIALDLKEVGEISGSFSGFLSEILILLQKEQGDFIFFNANEAITDVLKVVGFGDRIRNNHVPMASEEKLVLVVEDEPMVRELTREYLAELGYTCFEAENGLEGLRKYMMFKDVIRFVVTDMEMPIIDGAQMVQRIMEIDPEVKVILATGFANDEKIRLIRGLKNDVIVLQKPYLCNQLEDAVRRLVSVSVNIPR